MANSYKILLNFKDNFDSVSKGIEGKLDGLKGKFDNLLGGSKIGGKVAGGIGIAATAIAAYGQQLIEVDRQQRQFISTFGELNTKANAVAQTISKFSGESQENVLRASQVFQQEFGLGVEESLSRVQVALNKGANANQEFFDSLRQYPTQFKEIGINAEETLAIITAQGRMGIFGDKGADSIKEAALNLTRFEDAAMSALAPLDDSVEAQIRQKVAAGETFEAIKLISNEVRKGSLTIQQEGRIISDVFGSAGEDAGRRWITAIADIEGSLDNFEDRVSKLTKAQQGLNTEWANFKQSILDADGSMGKLLANAINGLAGFTKSLTRIERQSGYKEEFGSDTMRKLRAYQRKYGSNTLAALVKEFQANDPNSAFRRGTSMETRKGAKEYIEESRKMAELILKGMTDAGVEITNAQRGMLRILGADVENKTAKGSGPTIPNATIPNAPIPKPPGRESNLTPSIERTSRQVSSVSINVEKQIETVNINSNQNPNMIKDMLQKALTQLILDAKIAV
jgi:hypothetical protein